jgi:uncharacterized protein YsxB (DUF464 family)
VVTITELYSDKNLIGFDVSGHANYSIPGRDIVCASISTLTINTINSIYRLSQSELEYCNDDEHTKYTILDVCDTPAEVLIKAAQIGYKSITDQYPDNVSYIERR